MAPASRAAAALGAAVLLALLPGASARLLAGGRTERPSIAVEPELPALQLVHRGQAHSHNRAWALKGTPTHYTSTGCKKVTKIYEKVDNTLGLSAMSIARCFGFCAKRKGLSYFGLGQDACWCGKATDSTPLTSDECDKPCPGDPDEMCGGIVGTSVFVMFDCTNATKEEIAEDKAAKRKALISSYGSFTGQTCGQGKKNDLALDGKGFMAGKADDCKIQCWEGKGAEVCHGFTYDSLTSKCTFHYDVTDGPVEKNPTATCYFKIP